MLSIVSSSWPNEFKTILLMLTPVIGHFNSSIFEVSNSPSRPEDSSKLM